MPLALADSGRDVRIRHIGGGAQQRRHLENLGFVVGGTISVVGEMSGNLIVKVKDARVALSREMANKIMVQ